MTCRLMLQCQVATVVQVVAKCTDQKRVGEVRGGDVREWGGEGVER